ncbi:DapH/DapD/GlmU-related protein [Xenorhabdus lircayensis]|uniref:Acyltransferase n=1 Tax=Xenorhabdus lircayensis TaxID=2763499 RepID=A0ABS0U2A5_9GAMM|nr:DapH/DapD/GlmU-related protein [Xenorhabdus lircayensis]MBI6548020.1 acyltransferase [Xenorhabdus lircayensis]
MKKIFSKLFKKNIFDYIYFIEIFIPYLKTQILYKYLFKKVGNNSWIKCPDRIFNAGSIEIGSQVKIEKGSILYAVNKYADKTYNGKIIIGDGVYANRYFNITAAESVIIGHNVSFGPNVFINDFDHSFEDIGINIIISPLKCKGGVYIGDGSWIGANVFITGGVTIGKHCVIAANSVVTKSFPDYSVVAGIPAKIIKKYCHEDKMWVKV